jgi:hypothetical protein
MPTPSFNLLAPYGPPRIPPPATYSYGQSGLAPPAATASQPYYPAAVNVRGVSLPLAPESGSIMIAPPQGKVAQAIWKSSRPPAGEGVSESETSLVSYESTETPVTIVESDDVAIRVAEAIAPPAEPAKLVLGGMRAHDLTKAVAREQGGMIVGAPTTTLASASLPVATQVISAAPVARTAVAAPAKSASGTATSSGLVEITDLPQASAPAGHRSLKRVRGYESSGPATTQTEVAPDTFISPQMTISASAALEARDAVAAAAVESEAVVKPVSTGSSPGWKSRYTTDES